MLHVALICLCQQGGRPNNVPEKSIVRSETTRDEGKLSVAAQASVSAMPFKEHHLKQLRAQCLVFLAFRYVVRCVRF